MKHIESKKEEPRRPPACVSLGTQRMKSTVGRPRRVTDAQIRTILDWHETLLACQAKRKNTRTIRQLAAQLGLSTATISDVIRSRGEFKQPPPDERARNIEIRHIVLVANAGQSRLNEKEAP